MSLHKLVWNGAVKQLGIPTLKIPDALIRKWGDHACFSEEFANWRTANAAIVDVTIHQVGSPDRPHRGLKRDAAGAPKTEVDVADAIER